MMMFVHKYINETQHTIRADGVIEDYCDGSHPLFSKEPNSIQIIAPYDEL